MTGFIEGNQEFQLFDVHRHSTWRKAGAAILARPDVAWLETLRQGRWSEVLFGQSQRTKVVAWDITPQWRNNMSLFSFVKEAGEKLIDLLTPGNANAEETLKKHISDVGLGNPNVQATVDGDKITLTGEVASQEEKEKIVLAAGNIAGVGSVDDQLTVAAGAPAAVAAKFVTVEKGDTLSAISKRVYGDANKYQKIFDANKPMLKDVNKIYPGQVLRIPE
jgi:nucleoid-associated protein YgaU